MAHQYISIKVSGNQIASTGFVPLLLYNNPDIDIPDKGYVGFDNCSYFYTITTSESQNIFKLVKNNVRSAGAIRPGNLVIAFSLPKHYKLDGGFTPYDVLGKLKDEFLRRCMTLKDAVRDAYEFNSGRIDQHVLDEVASEFTISPSPSPNRIMNANAPKGYIVKSDTEIEKLFHDINYPEFDNYSEVIVAESVSQTSYTLINNIQIPRPKSYSIYVDGVFKMACADLNQTLTASSNSSPEYYDNKNVHFTIQNLKDGDILPGIELQEVNERVLISTQGWATPKTRRIELQIVPREFENYFFTNRNLLKIIWPHGIIRLDQDLSFTLEGEQIAEIKKGTIKVSLEQNGKFTLSKYAIYGNELRITVEEIKRQVVQNPQGAGQHRYQQQERVTDLQVINTSPVYDVSILLMGKEKFESSNEIDIKLKTHPEKSNITLATCRTKFKALSKSNETFEGHFYVSKELHSPYVYLSFLANGENYITKQPLSFCNDKASVEERDFAVYKVKPLYKKKNFIILMISYIICLLVGFCGYAAYDYIKNKPDETKRNIENPANANEDVGLQSMSETDAKVFLTNAKSVLEKKDLTLNDVVTFYNKYQTARTLIDNVDEKDFEKKVCVRIEDYYKVAYCIQYGDLTGLEALNIDTLHIWPIHKDVVKKILKDDVTKGQFMDNYSSITRFADIEENLKTDGYDSGAASTNQQNTGNRSLSSNRNSTTLQTSSNTTIKKTYWDCEKCKETGKTTYRYNDQDTYNKHLESHKER